MVIADLLRVIAASGVIGLSDQYACLFLFGLANRLGFVTVHESVAFVGEPWFLGLVVLAWLLNVPASAIPDEIAPLVADAVNFLHGPVTFFSGALFALASAGYVATLDPRLVDVMYLLTHDASWLSFASYRTADWAVVGGGALVAGGATFAKFVVKQGLRHLIPMPPFLKPVYALLENSAALALVPLVLWLQRDYPWLLVVLIALALAALGAVAWLALRALQSTGARLVRIGRTMIDRFDRGDQLGGLAIASELVVWGTGWLLVGQWGRGLVMLALWSGAVAIGTILTAGLLLPALIAVYCYVAPRTAGTLAETVERRPATRTFPAARA
ncbi:MAG: DUF4126 family protein [Chloroflexi bacterium]|nr:DUF4126 family protein [Chloroflexota bacterium]